MAIASIPFAISPAAALFASDAEGIPEEIDDIPAAERAKSRWAALEA